MKSHEEIAKVSLEEATPEVLNLTQEFSRDKFFQTLHGDSLEKLHQLVIENADLFHLNKNPSASWVDALLSKAQEWVYWQNQAIEFQTAHYKHHMRYRRVAA
jgi:hypothetical protein